MPRTYDPRVVAALNKYARTLPADARPYYVATALVESGGNPRAVGDNGNSGGLFQENTYGRGAGIPMEQRFDPDGNASRAAREFNTFYQRGARGADLAYRAQRPADQGSYVQKINQNLAEARRILGMGGTASAAPSAGTPAQDAVGQQPGGQVDIGATLAQGIAARPKGASLHKTVTNSLMQIAMQTAGQSAVSPEIGLKQNPSGQVTPPGGEGLVAAGKRYLGTPYSWGGGTPSGPSRGFGRGANTVGFDCSSLVQNIWATQGVKLPRVTYDQIKVGRGIPTNDMSKWQVGDLLFPSTGHVQMYIGGGKVIEAPRTGGVVQIVPVRTSYIAVRRPRG